MADIFDPSSYTDVTVDESPGLQTSGIPNTHEDNNDHDISLDEISALLLALNGLGAPLADPDLTSAARNRVLSFVEGVDPTLTFSLLGGGDSVATSLTTTVGGDLITLVKVDAHTLFGYADYGGSGERIALAVVLEPIAPSLGDPGGARVTLVQYEALAHPDDQDHDDPVDLSGLVFVDASGDIQFADFSAAPAGQNLWNAVTDTVSGVQVLITGLQLGVDTVNTRATSLGSNNQAIDPGEGLTFDFVTGQTTPTSTTAKSLANIDFTERHEGPNGNFTLVQVGGSPSNRVDARVIAYDSGETGADFHDGMIGGAVQTISAVEVWFGSTLVRSWDGSSASGSDAMVNFARVGDGVNITGLLRNYEVKFFVDVVDGDDSGVLDRFSVQNVSSGQGNKSFDLGNIGIGAQLADRADLGSYLRFEDDGPLDISPEHGMLANAAGLPVSFRLDEALPLSDFATNFGRDGASAAHNGVIFAGSSADDGAELYAAGTTTQLTSGGLPIYLKGFGTELLTAYTGSGMTEQTVFTVHLDGSSGLYSVDMEAMIDNGSIAFDNFGSGGAGLRYWLGVAGDQDASKDLLITGGNPGSDPVNNDSDDIAIGNQWIDPDEMVRLDFVNGIGTTTGTSNLNNIPLASHYTVNDVGFTVMQTKANSQVDVRIAAIDAARNIDGTDGTSVAADLQAGSLDTITSVTVINGGVSTTYIGSVAGVVTFNGDGSVIVYNLDAPSAATRDQVFVSTGDGFTRLEISNVDANKQHAFAIGGFEIGGEAGDPVALAFDVNVVDGDGDMAVGLIGITLEPEPF